MILRGCAVSLAVLLAAREAAACEPDPCGDAVAIRDVARASSADVPTDGVLVLKADVAGDLDPEQLLNRVHVTVTRDDVALPGTLGLGPAQNLLIWRPADPLQPLTAHAVAITADNPGAPVGCSAPDSIDLEFTTTDTASAPLVAPTVDAVTNYLDDPLLTLTTVVCCNDAYPGDQVMCGVSYGVTWSRGLCAAIATRGYLRVQLTADPLVDKASAGQWVRLLRQDGELVAGGVATTFIREIEAPACFRIDQRSMITGEVAEGTEQCFGESDADRLGTRPLDPHVEIGDQCHSDLYTCAIDEGYWDPMHCMSWGLDEAPPEDEDPMAPAASGCDCRGAGSPLPAVLLLALAPRRRPRRLAASSATRSWSNAKPR